MFGFGRKKETIEKDCAVKILGSGCAKCEELEEELEAETRKALAESGLPVEIEHVHDFKRIAQYGVMQTPALVINGKVAFSGKVLKKEEIKPYLQTLGTSDGSIA